MIDAVVNSSSVVTFSLALNTINWIIMACKCIKCTIRATLWQQQLISTHHFRSGNIEAETRALLYQDVISLDNGLSLDWHQAIIWTNAACLLIGLRGTIVCDTWISIR